MTLYLLALWLCKGLLVLILSVSIREDSTALISFFYPNNQDWYISTAPALFGFVALMSMSLRDTLREREALLYQQNMRIILGTGLLITLIIQFMNVVNQEGQFSITTGILIFVSLGFGLYLLRSKHTKLFCADTAITN